MPATREKPAKIDLSKEHSELYSPSAKTVSVVEVPELLFTSVDGRIEAGDSPGESERFAEDVDVLSSVGYGLKSCPSSERWSRSTSR